MPAAREGGAEIIDFTTRNVLPAVAQRKGRSEGFGLAAGVGIVALLGAVTLWSLDASRQEQGKPQVPIQPAVQALVHFPHRCCLARGKRF